MTMTMTKRKILVVEDDDDLRRGLALRLKASDYDVVLAADGLAAVSTAREEQPDLVLLDIGLPGGSGLTVLRRYSDCAALMFTPVVVLTGRDPMAIEDDVRKFGVAGFLTKPAENDALLGAIERALRGEPDPGAPLRESPGKADADDTDSTGLLVSVATHLSPRPSGLDRRVG